MASANRWKQIVLILRTTSLYILKVILWQQPNREISFREVQTLSHSPNNGQTLLNNNPTVSILNPSTTIILVPPWDSTLYSHKQYILPKDTWKIHWCLIIFIIISKTWIHANNVAEPQRATHAKHITGNYRAYKSQSV